LSHIIANIYEIIETLEHDSISTAYLCRHREVEGLRVVLRVLFPEVSAQEETVLRIKKSIMGFYGVTHPNVLKVFEYAQFDDLVFYTTEWSYCQMLCTEASSSLSLPVIF
jgi:hypothetical protein